MEGQQSRARWVINALHTYEHLNILKCKDAILKGRDCALCADHLLISNLKFSSGFCHPILNECKRGTKSSFSEEDKHHFKLCFIQMADYIGMILHLRDCIYSASLRLKLSINPKAKDYKWYKLVGKSSTQQPQYKYIFSFNSEYL